MKTKVNRLLFALLVLLSIFGLLRILNVVSFYTVSTVNMEPNFNVGERIFASNLIGHQRGSVVVYRSKSLLETPNMRNSTNAYLGRIIAEEGDELELRDGYVFVNGELAEKDLNLQFIYEVSQSFIEDNDDYFRSDAKQHHLFDKDKGLVFLPTSSLKQLSNADEIKKMNANMDSNHFEFLVDKPIGWSLNDYGPLKIPIGKYFILGDNRHNSEDSRHKGFVDKTDVLATVYK